MDPKVARAVIPGWSRYMGAGRLSSPKARPSRRCECLWERNLTEGMRSRHCGSIRAAARKAEADSALTSDCSSAKVVGRPFSAVA
eukprot:2021504-Lingulodinium_polyedra.AAC.1